MTSVEGDADTEDERTSEGDQTPGPATSHPSSSRMQRNRAEKQRRDKLNQHISELSRLVPLVSSSAKKLDKTSILRLSATFLRMYRCLPLNVQNRQPFVPDLDSSSLTMSLVELLVAMESFILIVTSSGKIVFVSHFVDKLLGHQQTDLMGQSLFSITRPEDQALLREQLAPGEGGGADEGAGELPPDQLRRCFRLHLQRGLSRGEQPHYELMQINGYMHVPPQPPDAPRHKGKREVCTNSGETVLVAVATIFRPPNPRPTIFEGCDQYITRHLQNANIVSTDHRISLIAGYMTDEVFGLCAFNFMHHDDAKFAFVALQHMLTTKSQPGESVYRLKVKTGDYIYLRTVGFTEKESAGNENATFVCINTVLTKEEGEKGIREMKERFAGIIKQKMLMEGEQEGEDETVSSTGNAIMPKAMTSSRESPMDYTELTASISSSEERAQQYLDGFLNSRPSEELDIQVDSLSFSMHRSMRRSSSENETCHSGRSISESSDSYIDSHSPILTTSLKKMSDLNVGGLDPQDLFSKVTDMDAYITSSDTDEPMAMHIPSSSSSSLGSYNAEVVTSSTSQGLLDRPTLYRRSVITTTTRIKRQDPTDFLNECKEQMLKRPIDADIASQSKRMHVSPLRGSRLKIRDRPLPPTELLTVEVPPTLTHEEINKVIFMRDTSDHSQCQPSVVMSTSRHLYGEKSICDKRSPCSPSPSLQLPSPGDLVVYPDALISSPEPPDSDSISLGFPDLDSNADVFNVLQLSLDPNLTEQLDLEDESYVAQEIARQHLQLESNMQRQQTQMHKIDQNLPPVPLADHLRSNLTQLQAQHKKQQELLNNLKQDRQKIQSTKLDTCKLKQDVH